MPVIPSTHAVSGYALLKIGGLIDHQLAAAHGQDAFFLPIAHHGANGLPRSANQMSDIFWV